jgi:hypothetical protein
MTVGGLDILAMLRVIDERLGIRASIIRTTNGSKVNAALTVEKIVMK